MRQVSGCSEVFRSFLPVFADFHHFSALFTRNSPVAGSVRWPFLSFLTQFRPEIPLLQGPFVGPLGPPAGIRERSERDLTRVAQCFDTRCALVHLTVLTVDLVSVASEL